MSADNNYVEFKYPHEPPAPRNWWHWRGWWRTAPMCGDRYRGWLCCRLADHTGRHAAYAGRGVIRAVWGQRYVPTPTTPDPVLEDMVFYYAVTDFRGVHVIGMVHPESQGQHNVGSLAGYYPDIIYFGIPKPGVE